MSFTTFLYVLPELFVFTSSFWLLSLGLISFSKFTGPYSLPGQRFSWGYFHKYSLDLRRSSLETFRSFFVVTFFIAAFLVLLCYDYFVSSEAVFYVICYGSYDVSYFTAFAKLVVSLSFVFFVLLLLVYYDCGLQLRFRGFSMGFEAFYLILLALLSSLFIVSSSSFLSFYLSLELQTLILYVLVSLNRVSATATEGALKYLILGALSTGLMLFGISLFYGLTSLLSFFEASTFFSMLKYTPSPYFPDLISFSLVLIFSSFFFKFSIFPFYIWAPDVYEGSPTPVMIFIAIFGKLGVLFLLVKLLILLDLPNSLFVSEFSSGILTDVVVLLSFLTVFVGSVGGLFQSKIKRLWGYSAVTNLGFVFLALSTFSGGGFSSAVLYLLFYTLLNFLFFSVYVSFKFRTGTVWSDLRYLAQLGYIRDISSFFYYALCFVLISFLSFPPLLNFIMKLYVLWAVYFELTSPSIFLIVSFLLLNLIASFYYLRLYRFIVSQRRSDFFYAPIFYAPVPSSAYSVCVLFILLYLSALVYHNQLYTFLDTVFNSYSVPPDVDGGPLRSPFLK